MAQDYYFNSTKINDWDGAKGVIVSTIAHDSSPEVSITEADVARGPGKVLRQSLPRSKRIAITGAIIGTDQADFEARMDSLKALLARPGQLTITNYGTVDYRITTFDYFAGFTGANTGVDTTYVRVGRSSTSLLCSGAATVTATSTQAHDLSAFSSADTITLSAYTAVPANVSSVVVTFTTSGGNYYTATFPVPTLGAWNDLTILRSACVATGSPSWANITSLSTTVTSSGTTTVFLDDLRITNATPSRTYDVALDGPIQFSREPHNINWVPFSLSLTCSNGSALSSITTSVSSPTSTKGQVFLPRYLAGAGKQDMTIKVDTGTATPAHVVVADHFTDTFASYAATANLADTYFCTGTWTLASYQAYPSVLAEVTAGAGYKTAAIRNTPIADGEIIGLFAPGTGPFGFFARASVEATPFTGSYVAAITSGTPNLFDSSILNLKAHMFLSPHWWWARLVCKGDLVELYIRGVGTFFSSPPSDSWVKVASGTTSVRGTGAWGIHTNSAAVRCAYLEVIDYNTDQTNAISFRTASNAQKGVTLDTRTLTADALASDAAVSGSFPSLSPGFQFLTAYMPSSSMGSSIFYQIGSNIGGYDAFGGAGPVRLGLTFSTGSNTYIRERGTFLYLGSDTAGAANRGDITVELQETTAGLPNGTIPNDIYGNPATVTITEASVAAMVVAANASYNASLIPIEVPWNGDIFVSSSTTYALVVKVSGVMTNSWYMPRSLTAFGALPLVTSPTNAAAWSSTAHYGFAVLEGDVPFGDTSTPARIRTTYTPSFL